MSMVSICSLREISLRGGNTDDRILQARALDRDAESCRLAAGVGKSNQKTPSSASAQHVCRFTREDYGNVRIRSVSTLVKSLQPISRENYERRCFGSYD
jgi:hypothetical protein